KVERPMTTGRIHSYETCGTVDGPGVRFVLFTQGCPLRCLYCHNPDSWDLKGGKITTSEQVVLDVKKYKSYMRFSGGGLTISGGEPLMQPEFVLDVIKGCRQEGIHTALDTSGIVAPENVKEIYNEVDMVLLDIKSFDPQLHLTLTGLPQTNPLKTAQYLSDIGKRFWLRHVLVPNYTINTEHLEALATFAATLKSLELVELLPFHKMGEYKWEQLGFDYKLSNSKQASREEVALAAEIFRKKGLKVQESE
ncbi:MAG: pyruvate formate-lyase-activating protein, partial [Lentisphaeria bacterium]